MLLRLCQYKKGDDARLRAALDALDNERDANARLRADFERYKRRSNKVLRGAKKPRGNDAAAKAADRAALVAADAAITASRTSAAATQAAQNAMTSAVKVAARLAHAKAAEAKRKARLAIQAAQKRPAAPPPAPATPEAPPPAVGRARTSCGRWRGDDGAVDDPPPTPAPAPTLGIGAPAGEGGRRRLRDDDDDRPEAPGRSSEDARRGRAYRLRSWCSSGAAGVTVDTLSKDVRRSMSFTGAPELPQPTAVSVACPSEGGLRRAVLLAHAALQRHAPVAAPSHQPPRAALL